MSTLTESFSILIPALEQGLIYTLVTLAVYMATRVARLDDFTIEGSFALGGAVTVLSFYYSLSGLSSVITSFMVGCCAGIITVFLRHVLRISALMSGLIVTTGLFSCNLWAAGAHAVLNLDQTIFFLVSPEHKIFLLLGISIVVLLIIAWFLKTELGLLLKATGDNKQMVIQLGYQPVIVTGLTLALANGFSATAGSLFAQWSGYFSIMGSVGTLVTGLTSLVLSELLFGRSLYALLMGSCCFQLLFALIIELGFDPLCNNLCKAVCIIMLVLVRRFMRGEKHA